MGTTVDVDRRRPAQEPSRRFILATIQPAIPWARETGTRHAVQSNNPAACQVLCSTTGRARLCNHLKQGQGQGRGQGTDHIKCATTRPTPTSDVKTIAEGESSRKLDFSYPAARIHPNHHFKHRDTLDLAGESRIRPQDRQPMNPCRRRRPAVCTCQARPSGAIALPSLSSPSVTPKTHSLPNAFLAQSCGSTHPWKEIEIELPQPWLAR